MKTKSSMFTVKDVPWRQTFYCTESCVGQNLSIQPQWRQKPGNNVPFPTTGNTEEAHFMTKPYLKKRKEIML